MMSTSGKTITIKQHWSNNKRDMGNSQAKQDECCPPGSIGEKSAFEAGATTNELGEMITINGVDCYKGKGKDSSDISKGSIIFFHDMFGFKTIARTKHICDEYANNGFLVIMPNFFQHVSFANRIRLPWSKYEGKFLEAVSYLRENNKESKNIFAVGFCWGGWACVRAAGMKETPLSAICIYHPSLHLQMLHPMFEASLSTIVANVKTPTLCCPSWTDPSSLRPDGSRFLQIKRNNPQSECVYFENMSHGFVNRGDVRKEQVRRDVERAIDLGIKYLLKHSS